MKIIKINLLSFTAIQVKRANDAAEILVNNGFQDVTNAQGVKEFEYDLVQYDDVRGEAFEALIEENKDIVLVDVRPAKQAEEDRHDCRELLIFLLMKLKAI